MESRARFAGHPIHPMLNAVPLGLFLGAVVFDALYLWRGFSTVATVSYWNIALGIVAGLLAATFGFVDWLAIPAGNRGKTIGIWRAFSTVIAMLGFAFVFWMRHRSGEAATTIGLFAVELIALCILGVDGWFGSELVDRLGVGVDSDANLNAPNSMSVRRSRAA